MVDGDAAEHLCGVLHVRYRPVVRSQLGIVEHREGPMIPLHRLGSGSDQVYLCFAPSAMCKRGAHQITVAIWNTCRLNIRGKATNQPASQRLVRDNGFDAAPNARRGVA